MNGNPAVESVWKTATTADGRTYYYNTIDMKTQWDPPPGWTAPELGVRSTQYHTPGFHLTWYPQKGDWVEYLHEESGKPYWYNKVTKITTWERPADFVAGGAHAQQSRAPVAQ